MKNMGMFLIIGLALAGAAFFYINRCQYFWMDCPEAPRAPTKAPASTSRYANYHYY